MRSVRILYLFLIVGVVRLHAQSVGGTTSGAAPYCDSVNSGFLSLNNHNGAILYWEQSNNGQQSWTQIQNTQSTQSYNNLKITTSYRAIVKDGSFPQDTSTVSTISVHVPGIAGTIAGSGTYCSGSNSGTLTLSGTQGSIQFWQFQETGGAWQQISNTTFQHTFKDLIKTTSYRSVVERVQGCPADTSARALIEIDETSIGGMVFGGDSVCYGINGDTLVLTGYRGTIVDWLVSEDLGQSWESAQSTGTLFVYPTVTSTRWYVTVVKNGVCPADTSTPGQVTSYPRLVAEAGPDAFIKRYESLTLQSESNGTTIWRPAAGLSDSTAAAPVASPLETTVYRMYVVDPFGCAATDSVKITVEIPIPSAITPNGDGVNDQFEIWEIDKLQKNTLKIFDRWGTLVYEAAPYRNEWGGKSIDGANVPEDTYYFIFDEGKGEKPVSGHLLIKR